MHKLKTRCNQIIIYKRFIKKISHLDANFTTERFQLAGTDIRKIIFCVILSKSSIWDSWFGDCLSILSIFLP